MSNNTFNAAVMNSIRNGNLHEVAGDKYRGRNPVYREVQDPVTKLVSWKKVAKGLPFVKVS